MGESSILRSLHRLDTPVLVLSVRTLRRPRTHWLTRHHRFAGDFLARMTVSSMLIPQSVSYASFLAKLSPVTGLVCFLLVLPSAFILTNPRSVSFLLQSQESFTLCLGRPAN